ncbi:TniB family NTP-binding protein [Pseudomonas atacamensis]|uniref:TniB family NTP-binding protein n=1 Tax=Pseudomonas atacamensis TaxID=2565368 RepID=UPI001C3CEBF2|nr:TniB family NTP-binding protein [Pseudomonas atacamensis]QXH74793.1 TniB family NTP-binding protein [Pseudomonas atacamensis]
MNAPTTNLDDILEALAAHTTFHPDFLNAMRLINKCVDTTRHRKDPASAMLIGSTGVGKTRLCHMIKKQMGAPHKIRDNTSEHLVTPCVYVELPESATIKSLSMVLSRALGAQPTDYQSITVLETLIIERLRIMEVRLVILDDFHHIAEKGQFRTKSSLCNWIIKLLNKSGIPLLLSGSPAAENTIDAVQELSDRFPYRARLSPMPLSADNSVLLGVLSNLQKEMIRLGNLQNYIHLTDPKPYLAIYLSTRGNFRKLSDLLHDSFRIALLRGDHSLIQSDFAEAADDLAFCCSPNYFRMSLKKLNSKLCSSTGKS